MRTSFFFKSATRTYSVTFCTDWLSEKLKDFRESSSCGSHKHRKLQKGWRRRGREGGCYIRGTMAGIMETNATSGAKHAVLLLKEYRSFRVSSHCLTDSAKPRWAVTVLVLAAPAFRDSNFADAFAPRASFLPSCFYSSRIPSNARSASERESADETRPCA